MFAWDFVQHVDSPEILLSFYGGAECHIRVAFSPVLWETFVGMSQDSLHSLRQDEVHEVRSSFDYFPGAWSPSVSVSDEKVRERTCEDEVGAFSPVEWWRVLDAVCWVYALCRGYHVWIVVGSEGAKDVATRRLLFSEEGFGASITNLEAAHPRVVRADGCCAVVFALLPLLNRRFEKGNLLSQVSLTSLFRICGDEGCVSPLSERG